MVAMRLPQLDIDGVSLLVFHHFQISASDVPAASGDVRLNLVLIPHVDPDAGITRFDVQLWFASQVVGLRPIVRASRGHHGCEGQYGNQYQQGNFGHSAGSPGCDGFSPTVRRRYEALVRQVPRKIARLGGGGSAAGLAGGGEGKPVAGYQSAGIVTAKSQRDWLDYFCFHREANEVAR